MSSAPPRGSENVDASPSSQPRYVDWAQAVTAILAEVNRRRGSKRASFVVGITGPVGAGKSLLARRLGGTLLTTDDYLPDYEIVPFAERDDPRHTDLPLLAEHLTQLRAGNECLVPIWSFFSHRRESSRSVVPDDLVVVEGIHALEAILRPLLDLAVFVDAPASLRLARVEARERAGERGWTIEHVRDHFREVAEPSFARRAAACRASADWVVSNGKDN